MIVLLASVASACGKPTRLIIVDVPYSRNCRINLVDFLRTDPSVAILSLDSSVVRMAFSDTKAGKKSLEKFICLAKEWEEIVATNIANSDSAVVGEIPFYRRVLTLDENGDTKIVIDFHSVDSMPYTGLGGLPVYRGDPNAPLVFDTLTIVYRPNFSVENEMTEYLCAQNQQELAKALLLKMGGSPGG